MPSKAGQLKMKRVSHGYFSSGLRISCNSSAHAVTAKETIYFNQQQKHDRYKKLIKLLEFIVHSCSQPTDKKYPK